MILIIEHATGYLPLAEVVSIEEARETLAHYFQYGPENGQPAPESAALWYRNFDGDYVREELS